MPVLARRNKKGASAKDLRHAAALLVAAAGVKLPDTLNVTATAPANITTGLNTTQYHSGLQFLGEPNVPALKELARVFEAGKLLDHFHCLHWTAALMWSCWTSLSAQLRLRLYHDATRPKAVVHICIGCYACTCHCGLQAISRLYDTASLHACIACSGGSFSLRPPAKHIHAMRMLG